MSDHADQLIALLRELQSIRASAADSSFAELLASKHKGHTDEELEKARIAEQEANARKARMKEIEDQALKSFQKQADLCERLARVIDRI